MVHAESILPGHPTDRLVGTSPATRVLRAQIRHLASFDTLGSAVVPTLLLEGETGTAKGFVAGSFWAGGAHGRVRGDGAYRSPLL